MTKCAESALWHVQVHISYTVTLTNVGSVCRAAVLQAWLVVVVAVVGAGTVVRYVKYS